MKTFARLLPWFALGLVALFVILGVVPRIASVARSLPGERVDFEHSLEGFDSRAETGGEALLFLDRDPAFARRGSGSLGLRLKLTASPLGERALLFRSRDGSALPLTRLAVPLHASPAIAGLSASVVFRSGPAAAEARTVPLKLAAGWNVLEARFGPEAGSKTSGIVDLSEVWSWGVRVEAEPGRAVEGVLHADAIEADLAGLAPVPAPSGRSQVSVTLTPAFIGGRVPYELFGEERGTDPGGNPRSLEGLGAGPVRLPLFPAFGADVGRLWPAGGDEALQRVERALRGLRDAGRSPVLVLGTAPPWLTRAPSPEDDVALARRTAQVLRRDSAAPDRVEIAFVPPPSGDDRVYWDTALAAAAAVRESIPWARVAVGGWSSPAGAQADLRRLEGRPLDSGLYRHSFAPGAFEGGDFALDEAARFGSAVESLHRATHGWPALHAAVALPREARTSEAWVAVWAALWLEATRAGAEVLYYPTAGDRSDDAVRGLVRSMRDAGAGPGRQWMASQVQGAGVDAQGFRSADGWELAAVLVNPGEAEREATVRVVDAPGLTRWQVVRVTGREPFVFDGGLRSLDGAVVLPPWSVTVLSASLVQSLPRPTTQGRAEVSPRRSRAPVAIWEASWAGAAEGAAVAGKRLLVTPSDDCVTPRAPTDLVLFDDSQPEVHDALQFTARLEKKPEHPWAAFMVTFDDWREHDVGSWRALSFAFRSDKPMDLLVRLASDGDRRGPQVRISDHVVWRSEGGGWQVARIPLPLLGEGGETRCKGVQFEMGLDSLQEKESIEIRVDALAFTG